MIRIPPQISKTLSHRKIAVLELFRYGPSTKVSRLLFVSRYLGITVAFRIYRVNPAPGCCCTVLAGGKPMLVGLVGVFSGSCDPCWEDAVLFI